MPSTGREPVQLAESLSGGGKQVGQDAWMPRHQDQGRWYPELRQAQRASGTAGAQSGAADTRGRQGEIRGPTACKGLSDSGRTRMRPGTGQGCGGGALLQRGREDSDSSGPGERAAEYGTTHGHSANSHEKVASLEGLRGGPGLEPARRKIEENLRAANKFGKGAGAWVRNSHDHWASTVKDSQIHSRMVKIST